MSGLRIRVALGLAVALSLWPLLHVGLVFEHGLSAWKLGGWGMYATPRPTNIGLEVLVGPRPDGPLRPMSRPSRAVRARARELVDRFLWLGRLASAEALIEAVRAQQPQWPYVRVRVLRSGIDASDGFVRTGEFSYESMRP